MIESCKIMLDKKMEEGCLYSESSFEDDCSSIIKMYLKESSSEKNIGNGKDNATITYLEDSLECPLNDLGLIKRSTKKGAYIKASPSRGELDKLNRLLLPLPFFPSSTMRSPCLISNETGSTTLFYLNRRLSYPALAVSSSLTIQE